MFVDDEPFWSRCTSFIHSIHCVVEAVATCSVYRGLAPFQVTHTHTNLRNCACKSYVFYALCGTPALLFIDREDAGAVFELAACTTSASIALVVKTNTVAPYAAIAALA